MNQISAQTKSNQIFVYISMFEYNLWKAMNQTPFADRYACQSDCSLHMPRVKIRLEPFFTSDKSQKNYFLSWIPQNQ